METVKKKRAVYMDVLRILAAYMVIFGHTNERGYYRVAADRLGSLSMVVDTLMDIPCKAAVPMFFMISGALLIKKDEDYKSTFKRAIKIAVGLIVFSLFYFWVDALALGHEFSIVTSLIIMLNSNYWHLWYLYAYIIIIFMLPIMRKLVVGMDQKTSIYMFWMAFGFLGFFPIISSFAPGKITENLTPIWLMERTFLYPIWGYLLVNKIPEEYFDKMRIIRYWILNACCFAMNVGLEYRQLARTVDNPDRALGYFDETFLLNFCLLNATIIFVTVRYICKRINFGERATKVITEIGADTYGIYILHILFLWRIPALYAIWMKFEHAGVLGYHFGILLSCLGVFITAGITTAILRRIPVIKKLF